MWFPCQPHQLLFCFLCIYLFISPTHTYWTSQMFLVCAGGERVRKIKTDSIFTEFQVYLETRVPLRWMCSWRSWGQVRTTKVQIQLAGTANPCPKMVKNFSQHKPPYLLFVFRLFLLCDGTSSKKGSTYPFLSFCTHSYEAFVNVISFNEDAMLMGPVYNEAAQWMDVKKIEFSSFSKII